MQQCYTPSESLAQPTVVTLDEVAEDVQAEYDPAGALADLEREFVKWERGPFPLQWRRVANAHAALIFHSEEARRKELWAAARAGDSELEWLVRYGVEADKRYAKSDKRKASKSKYDRKNAKTPKRQAQVKEAKARHKAKLRALKIREVANDRAV